ALSLHSIPATENQLPIKPKIYAYHASRAFRLRATEAHLIVYVWRPYHRLGSTSNHLVELQTVPPIVLIIQLNKIYLPTILMSHRFYTERRLIPSLLPEAVLRIR